MEFAVNWWTMSCKQIEGTRVRSVFNEPRRRIRGTPHRVVSQDYEAIDFHVPYTLPFDSLASISAWSYYSRIHRTRVSRRRYVAPAATHLRPAYHAVRLETRSRARGEICRAWIKEWLYADASQRICVVEYVRVWQICVERLHWRNELRSIETALRL